jgi:hypothetical protein
VGILPVNLNDRHPEVGSDSVGDPEPAHKRVKRGVGLAPNSCHKLAGTVYYSKYSVFRALDGTHLANPRNMKIAI